MEKYLKISAESSRDDEGFSYDVDDIKVEEVNFWDSIDKTIDGMHDYALQSRGLIKLRKDKKGNFSPETVRALRDFGWAHVETAKDIAEKKILEEKFFMVYPPDHKNFRYSFNFLEVDVENLTDDQIKDLATGTEIVQVVSVKSVLPAEAYERYEKAKQRHANLEKARKEAAAKKKEEKKRQEIENAKKLLEEAGLEVK